MAIAHWKTAAYLGILWWISLLYGENLMFTLVPYQCSWPDLSRSKASDGALPRPAKLLLISDPQLTGWYLSPSMFNLAAPSRRISQFTSDLFMRRAFRMSVMPMAPDAIVIMGDILNGRPQLTTSEWKGAVARISHIFDQSRSTRRSAKVSVPMFTIYSTSCLSPNGSDNAQAFMALEDLGPQEGTFKLGGMEVVVLNPAVVAGSNPEGGVRVQNLLSKLSERSDASPRLLLSPNPLHRENRPTRCLHQSLPSTHAGFSSDTEVNGSAPLNTRAMLFAGPSVTDQVLKSVKPIQIFSGHDHRRCRVEHPGDEGTTVTESTLGTFSPIEGTKRPSFTLVSIAPAPPHGQLSRGTGEEPIVDSHTCLLPSAANLQLWYILVYALSVYCLLFPPTTAISLAWESSMETWKLAFKREKLKTNDDAPTEYDVMFDVEGAMHLISRESGAKPAWQGQNQNQGPDRKDTGVVARANPVKRADGEDEANITTAASVFAGARAPLMAATAPSRGDNTGQSNISLVGNRGGGKADATGQSSNAVLSSLVDLSKLFKRGSWRAAAGPAVVLGVAVFSMYIFFAVKDWTQDLRA